MTKTLIIQSTPVTGIEMSVEWVADATPQQVWIVTNKTLTLPDIATAKVTAPDVCGEPMGTEELGWKFVKWEDGSTERKRTVTLNGSTTVIATYEQQVYYPTRHYTRRKQKFEAKVDDEVYGLRTTALKPMMVEQQEVTTAQQARIESLVGDYLNAQGLYGLDLHHYRNFSMELWGLSRLFKSATLNKEASEKAKKWKTRGLQQTHLENIAKLFGITLTFT